MDAYLSIERHYREFPICEWQPGDLFDEEVPLFKEFPEYVYARQLLRKQTGLLEYSLICITKKLKKKYIEYIYYFNNTSPFKIKARPQTIFKEDLVIEHGEYRGKILKYEFSEDDKE